jgi:DNA-binding SARP family transcriptional activator
METIPMQAEAFLRKARTLFIQIDDRIGELLASIHLVFFHLTIDARFNEGIPLLFRAEELYLENRDSLDEISRIWILQVMASGFVYFEGNIERMEEYTAVSLRMAESKRLENFIATARIINCYKGLFLGNWDLYRKYVEASLPTFINPHTSRILRLFLCATRVNLLEREGDFENYRQEKSFLLEEIGDELVAQTVIGPWLLIWDAEFAISRGSFDEALALLDQGMRAQDAGRTPHIRSILLQHLAYLHALRGCPEEAVKAAGMSQELRAMAGGEWFRIMNEAVLGGTFAVLGMEEKAVELLNRAMERSDRMGEEHLRTTLLVHRALLKIRKGEFPSEDLKAFFHHMRKNGFRRLTGVYPPLMIEILDTAFKGGIEPEEAQALAENVGGVALRASGTPFPQMRIHAFGPFRIELAGKSLKGHELSSAQRELLGLILSRPDLQIRQEEAQCLLWPERPPEKSRSSFDTLLSRLRGLMESRFPGHPVREYLSLNKGVLRLNYCRVDIQKFICLIESGLAHARKREFWQAGNALRTAFGVWEGPFHPGGEQNLIQFKEDLEQLYIKGAVVWSDILALLGRSEEGVQVLLRALKFDRTNDPLVRKIHHLQLRDGRHADAAKTLRNYRKALELEGYPPAEVNEILDAFWDERPQFFS